MGSDLTNPRLIWLKGCLFVGLGTLASGLLLAEMDGWKPVALLAIAIWAFCRSYYFAFYVIQHYVDPKYRFAGLIDFAHYTLNRGSWDNSHHSTAQQDTECRDQRDMD